MMGTQYMTLLDEDENDCGNCDSVTQNMLRFEPVQEMGYTTATKRFCSPGKQRMNFVSHYTTTMVVGVDIHIVQREQSNTGEVDLLLVKGLKAVKQQAPIQRVQIRSDGPLG